MSVVQPRSFGAIAGASQADDSQKLKVEHTRVSSTALFGQGTFAKYTSVGTLRFSRAPAYPLAQIGRTVLEKCTEFWASGYTRKLDLKPVTPEAIRSELSRGIADDYRPSSAELAALVKLLKNGAGPGGKLYRASCYGDRNDGVVYLAVRKGHQVATAVEVNTRWY